MAVEAKTSAGPPPTYRPVSEMGLGDLEVLRLILRGGSVVDWRRLHFRDAAEVDHFLRLNLFDLSDPRDEGRLRTILAQAVDYLRTAFGYRVAEAVASPRDLRDLFLLASGAVEPHRYRRIACVVLKCMHVVHHLEARELLFRSPVREADLAELVDRRVMGEARRMVEAGFPIAEFHGNVKTRSSLVTKLLAKRETVAAQIFDRLRYRLVTERREQIAPVLHHLTRHLVPFNFAVPGQTQNNLVKFRQVVRQHPGGAALASELQAPLDLEASDPRKVNEFSGQGYRVLNFVVDLPLRIDAWLPEEEPARVVFALVEFQIMDQATARHNEEGDAAHDRYKRRQLRKVLRRLSRGLVVPKRHQKAHDGE